MNDALEKSHHELAIKFRKRSEDLEKLNRQLMNEIARHNETARLLKEKSDVLESLFANANFLVAYMDADFNYIRVNRAYAEAAGQDPGFFIGKNHFELYPHEENETIFRRVAETGESYTAFERPFESPDNRESGVIYWDWTLQAAEGVEGKTEGLILTLINVTERKLAEEEIRLRDKRYQEILNQSLDGFARTDMDGFFIETNQIFANMLGYTDDELRSLTFQDVTPAKWQRVEEKILRELETQGHTPLYEKEYMGKGGHKIPVELRMYLSRDEKGKPIDTWAFVRDITLKKETQKELHRYTHQLEQSNRELEEFARVASHDLQEPLRKIQTFGNRLVKKYQDVLDESGRDYLDRMVKAATRMRELIEALLTYSRISTRPHKFDSVDMNEAVQDALTNLEDRIDDTNAEVEVADLPEIEANRLLMVQLLQNLIGNALKFHKKGVRPMIRVGCTIKQSSGKRKRGKSLVPNKCEISVNDNGIGIAEKYAGRIFLPFQRLHGRTAYDGVGMGLSICRRIVERHGGSIRVKSVSGRGSTFIVTLPLKQGQRTRKSQGGDDGNG